MVDKQIIPNQRKLKAVTFQIHLNIKMNIKKNNMHTSLFCYEIQFAITFYLEKQKNI